MSEVAAQAPPASTGHRERLLAGMAASVREKGFRQTKISDVVRHARTSRRTFYEQFPDKETCYLELFEATGTALVEHVEAAVDPAAPWDRQVDQAIDAYVAGLALDADLMVSYARELPALGAAAVARERALMDRFADLVMRLADTESMRDAGVPPVAPETAVMLVGGLRELVTRRAEQGGEPASISAVAKDVVKAVLDPARQR
ncbi:TetR/AcrR family transcriptional regulator [Conexibacter sp. SYSU D00693]|uniref:TetR/AcrR family transcriptional regulator n=1 Tax=Conexibacter sp. SYSU D00693 TaxID=2812560 RepID=UPI00196A679F|nr:TetR/AcrR family transcriptional regulator [Conexibacter sp. SYSU D00693]